jgi:hypothetical protein
MKMRKKKILYYYFIIIIGLLLLFCYYIGGLLLYTTIYRHTIPAFLYIIIAIMAIAATIEKISIVVVSKYNYKYFNS